MKIDKVEIKNFKSLRDIEIDLSNLTLITGRNSGGKSSFIQSLLLLKQNEDNFYTRLKKPLIHNGDYIELGNKEDILFQDASEEEIIITIFASNIQTSLRFNNKDLKINLESTDANIFDVYNLFDEAFQYITTDRAIPSITYKLSDKDIEQNQIGFKGEYTAHYLAENRRKNLKIEALKHPNSITNQLLENVSLWLSEISDGIEISARVYSELQQVNLTYKYNYGNNTTNQYSPLNVGFGITYVLPIIVAILKAKEGDLLILENPESHLHPAAQSKIAELCSLASANGVQIIVETHSDHFLNGIRVATKKEILQPEDSQIYFFRKDKDELETKIDKLNIDNEGKIDKWPKGFFDEWDNQLDELLW
jgi:predicted ATPase